MGRIRVLVVDGHRIFAEALATALAAEPDVDVGAAGSAAAAERALERAVAERRPYDVVLVDADLGVQPPGRAATAVPAPRRTPAATSAGTPVLAQPRTAAGPLTHHQADGARPLSDGIALVGRVRRAHPELRAVLLAAADDPQRAVRALQAGANGWVARESSLGALMAVIRGVLREETHLPPALLTGVVRELTSARRDRSESERLVAALTPREEEVLRCMVAGLGRQAVAERLFLSPHTVRTHMQNVLGKLGVHSTLAAVAVARRAGIAPSEPPGPPAVPVPVPPPTVASTAGPGAG
ncbi:response regulator transcription factor [Streptomyces sp. TLI_171]|uniref:LuxR C-terminal-related transcriptional regulator n=1 Tax=Streptomyces sp. TLI_171 TaxID=1938859 RepID=UPI000C194132|nr:response regulator transcription factor [Streptomyces sp. TLI_171]RKE20827.1 LuxR family two component transcriptional regulator [Streptomyces sp. TLI_171]